MTGPQPPGARDPLGFGQQPGMNQSPLGPSFRDGPGRVPTSAKGVLLGLVPSVVIVVVVIIASLH